MAEIEPVGGPQGIPTESVLVEPSGSTPAAAPPAGAPSRPGGLVRWGVALVTLAVVVGAVSVAAAFLAAGQGGSAVRGWLPPGTIAYLEVRADLPGDQRAKVGDLLAKFPGFADQASLDAKIDEAFDRLLEGSDVSWTADVKPWLGGEIGIAVTDALLDLAAAAGAGDPGALGPADAPEDGVALLVGVKDAAKATAWVAGQVEGTSRTETYAGGEITLVDGPGGSTMAYAARGSMMVLGPEKTVRAVLDTKGASPVATSEGFKAALATAPNAYLGYGYLDTKAFVDAALAAAESAGQDAGVNQECLDTALAAVPAWASGSFRADTDLLVFTSTNPTAGEPPTTTASRSAIAARLPGSTLAAFELRDFGPGLVTAVDLLEQQLACDPASADMVDQLDQALAAVGGLEALIGWADDAAIAVDFADGTLGGGLAATVDDEAAAGRTIDQLRALLALGGAGMGLETRQESYGDGTLLVLTLPADVVAGGEAAPELAVTAQGGVFVLGTIDFVKAVVDTEAAGSLAASDVYERAIAAAGGDGVSDVFVDIAGIRAAVESLLPAAEKARYETDVKPYLVPFEAFAAVAEAPGATTVSRAVITFTK